MQVYRYRVDLIDKISKRTKEDIGNLNYNWEWRFVEFRKVGYQKMVWQFWKPIDSFYDLDKLLK